MTIVVILSEKSKGDYLCVCVCVCVSFVAGSGNSIQITDKL